MTTTFGTVFANDTTTLGTVYASAASPLNDLLGNSSLPLGTIYASSSSTVETVLANELTALEQVLISQPALLSTFLSSLTSAEQTQFYASLASLRTTINLPGSDNQVTAGLLTTVNLGPNSLLIESITPDELNNLTAGFNSGNTTISNYQLNATLSGGNNVVVAGLLSNITVSGGNNKFVIEDPTLLGVSSDTLLGLGVSNPTLLAAMYQDGGTFTNTTTNGGDQFYFVGGASSASFGNIVLNEPTGAAATDTLDFSNYQGGGVNLNLAAYGTQQQLNPVLNLTLPTTQVFSNVVGSPASDTIIRTGSNQTINGYAADVPDVNALPAVPPSNGIPTDVATLTTNPNLNPDFPAASPGAVQWVYLDFTSFLTPVEAAGNDSLPSAGSATSTPESLHNGTGEYSSSDTIAILNALENIYAQFTNGTVNTDANDSTLTTTEEEQAIQAYLMANPTALQGSIIQFTTNQTLAMDEGGANGYETVYFDVTPMAADANGVLQPSSGGESNEIDFRNLNLNTFMIVDVNGFLGGGSNQVPATDANWINLTVTVTAHELGHTLGLRHEDSLGPIGFGVSAPPGGNNYFPTFTDLTDDGLTAPLTGAFTTDNHMIASPASVGSSLADAASGQDQFGAREAVKLAFITNGTVVDGTATNASGYTVAAASKESVTIQLVSETPPSGTNAPPGTTTAPVSTPENAQPVSLYQLNVPNPITTGFDAGKTFDVDAVDVLGTLKPKAPDFYTFQGSTGDLMNFEVMSTALTRDSKSFDSVIYLYGPDGKLLAWNDDQFEPSDSSIVDFTLPADGTYTVEVDSYQDATAPSSDTVGGDYELFMYRFLAYNATPSFDTIVISNKSTPTVTVSDAGGTYTGQAFAATDSVAGSNGMASTTLEGVGLTLTYYSGNTVGNNALSGAPITAGTYTVVASFAGSADYAASSASFTFTIAPATPTITWNAPAAINYGTMLSSTQLDASANTGGSFAYSPTYGTLLGAGMQSLSVTFTPTDTIDYTTVSKTITVTVNPAPLTITANSLTSVYGATLPALSASYTGFVNGDTSASLTTQPTVSTMATAASPVGNYSITASGAVDANYTISYVFGMLTVTPAALTVTANNTSNVYGRGVASAVGQLQRLCQRRHERQSDHTADRQRHGHCCQSGRHLLQHGQRRCRCELQHHLHGRHADHHPGDADLDGQPGHLHLWDGVGEWPTEY